MEGSMKELLVSAMAQAGVALTPAQQEQFLEYYRLLIEWNEKMNLTAITEAADVFQKHFADSLAAAPYVKQGAALIDVGTGAGFPGVPLLILRPDLKVTLLDSLQKRLRFLEEVCSRLGLSARLVHARAEDAGRDSGLRGTFDCAVSRAVAPLPVLLELVTPFLKVGGLALCYKGPGLSEELSGCSRALALLCCRVKEAPAFSLPWGERTLALIEKTGKTPPKYPRKAGTPAKEPL